MSFRMLNNKINSLRATIENLEDEVLSLTATQQNLVNSLSSITVVTELPAIETVVDGGLLFNKTDATLYLKYTVGGESIWHSWTCTRGHVHE